ncbi:MULTISPECIES: hypothetical protein [Streptosporangiaceae]|uniref:hypothetical protein n=1 Tax=Streptosporangiaceae TaxID=2004 RepID=UPI0034118F12
MIELPREVIETAAKTGSLHYEDCKVGSAGGCDECRIAYVRAHYAVHGAVAAFPDEFIAAIQAGRAPTS